MTSAEIKRVRTAARRAASARMMLDQTMSDAHAAGASLRQIATAAELSVETTRRRIKTTTPKENI